MSSNKIFTGSNGLKINIPKFAIGQNSSNFSMKIVGKYNVFHKSDSLPALIFRRLSDVKTNNKSLYNEPFNIFISFQNFNDFINQFQKTLKLLSNSIIATSDVHSCINALTLKRYSSPASKYPEVKRYAFPVIATGKTDGISGRKTDTIVAYQKALNFNTSTNIEIVTQDIEKPFFKKTETDPQYGNNATGQIRERKKQFIMTFNQYPSYRNILISENPVTRSYLYNNFNFGLSGPEHSLTIASTNKTDEASEDVKAVTPRADIPSKVSANPIFLDYMHSRNIDVSGSEPNRIIYAAKKVDASLTGNFGTSKSTDSQSTYTLSPLQTRNSKNENNSTSGQAGEGKIQLITELQSLYFPAKSKIISLNSMNSRHLQRALNFKSVNSKFEMDFFSTKTADKASTVISPALQGIDSSFQQIGNVQNLKYGYFFNNDIKLTGRNVASVFKDKRILRKSTAPSQDNVFPYPLTDFKYVNGFMKRNRLYEVGEDPVYDSRELVLKKTFPQKVEVVSENNKGIQTENVSPGRIRNDLDKKMMDEKPVREIEIIADKVYKIIERRISIEKDRRGLF